MSRPTVVIVDDDRSFVNAVSIFLERRGYHTIGAVNGHEGLAVLGRDHIDLGIIDVHLPDISGIEVARAIRRINATLPMIMISSDDQPDVCRQCKEAGAGVFLPKPIVPEELMDAISATLQNSH